MTHIKWMSEPHDNGGYYQWTSIVGHPDITLWVSPEYNDPLYRGGKPTAYYTVAVDDVVVVEGVTGMVAASKVEAEQAAARIVAELEAAAAMDREAAAHYRA